MSWWAAAGRVIRDILLPRPITLDLQPLQAFDDTPQPIADLISAMTAGTGRVTRDRALQVAAIQRARNELCSIATLPLAQYKGLDKIQTALFTQLDPNVPNVVTLAATIEDLVFEGVAWWRITARDFYRWPTEIRHVPVGSVSLDPPSGASPAPLPSGLDPGAPGSGTVWVDGVPVPASEMIRFDSPNPGLLVANARAIRRALALDELALLYANNPTPMEILKPKDGPDAPEPPSDEEVPGVLAQWSAYRRASATAWLPENLEREDVSPSMKDLQLPDLQAQVALEIANGTGLDPEDLGVSTTSRTYFNAVDRRISKIQETRMPLMKAITDRLSMPDVTPRGHEVRWDLHAYLIADPITQLEFWKGMKEMGASDADEARQRMGIAGPAPKPAPAPVAAPPAGPAQNNARHLVALDDAPDGLQFSAGEFGEFAAAKVDVAKRTITGLALPYNRVATKYGVSYRFLPGSIKYADVSRVKHYKDHVTPMGVASALNDTEDGLVASLKVGTGPDRDALLQDAADGIYDGLSVGVDFQLDRHATWNEDERVWDVHTARLREISSTPMPAFDDARVTSVAASNTAGGNMSAPVAPAPTPPAAPATGPALQNFDMGALAALVAQHMGATPPVAAEVAAGPTLVDATARPALTATAQVNEPEPYRFDSKGRLRMGSHDFSTDLVAGSKGDVAAMDRVTEWVSKAFDTDRADVAALNPNRNRPDLYVDQREYRYPMWNAINKGTLQDSTPFVIPKFNSSSGLVNPHTEGVEPTPGTYTATSQTITPTAVSGKVEITREAWDQGGNPQMSGLIWRQMERAYWEALEARAVAVLDAATPAALATFTAGGGTGKLTLVSELTAGLAGLQFVRGGFSMDNMFAQIDLYKALIAAVATDGRPIYPALGPANTWGQTRERFGSIEVAPGVTAYPAWALAASGSVAASSYLFDSDSVHGWATAPRRLQFEYRVAYVDIGIWGYGATGITDINGVREISYDPVA